MEGPKRYVFSDRYVDSEIDILCLGSVVEVNESFSLEFLCRLPSSYEDLGGRTGGDEIRLGLLLSCADLAL